MNIIQLIKSLPSHLFLSIGIFLFVFVFPIVDRSSLFDFIGPLSYTIITLSIIGVIENKKHSKVKGLHILISISILFIWILYFTNISVFNILSFAFSIVVFMSASVIMITQIVESKTVNAKVIVEAINGYFLIGVMFTLTNTLLWTYNHDSIGIDTPEIANFGDYSFITLTTIGYGDIAPQSDFAKLASVFFGISGQLYLTIIMALIIGKFLSKKNN
ncbi:MAG: hypothetical protein GQ527_10960 [Bacteroidales bacterium]|nr:hypothetical protein [Bacteroidales bacterium]